MNNYQYIFGDVVNKNEISNNDISIYFSDDYLNNKIINFMKIPIDSILNVIEKTGLLLTDSSKPYYKQCLDNLPDILNYAPKMVEKAMSFIPILLNKKTMLDRLSHFGNHYILDYPVYCSKGIIKRAIPIGVVSHIAAGNTFLGAIDSLLYGIITKNVNIVKMSSNDRFFPIVFMNALKEADTQNIIFPYIAMVYWSHSNEILTNTIKNISDLILLFGGEESVKSFKKDISPKCDVLAFGPKISFGIVTSDLTKEELSKAAKGFANDIVFWEQRACTACQNIFLENSANSQFFIDALFSELENSGLEYPQEEMNIDSAVEIRKQRELAIWEEFLSDGKVYEGTTSNHTIIVNNSINLSESPLERTVIINLIDDWNLILNGSVKLLKYYMSTIAIASNHKQAIINRFLELGVMRFCSPGLMSASSNAGFSHDGKFIVESLVKYINFEDFNDSCIGFDYTNNSDREAILLSRINSSIANSLKTPYYHKKYEGISIPLTNINELKNLPPLTKNDMAEISAHHSNQAFSGEANNCYIFTAGGSTGLKKYVLYSDEEFSKSKELFGKGFRALGINQNNVVANIFPSGAFYTAFLAINKGLEETGCRILSMTGNISLHDILEYFKVFMPDTIFGVPAIIIPLAQLAEQNNVNLTIKNIIYAAEHLTQDAKLYIKKVFNTDRISSFGYAAVETGPIGYQCPYCKDNEFHVEEEWIYLESDENDEAIVTCLHKQLFPVIRYKVGDLIEFINEPCQCGRLTPKFQLKGRSGEKIRITGLYEFYFEDIEKTVQLIVDDGFIVQLTLEPDGIYTFLDLRIETKHFGNKELQDLLMQKILEKIPVLTLEKEKTLISGFKIALVQSNSLPRIERSGKVRRIIDNRI